MKPALRRQRAVPDTGSERQGRANHKPRGVIHRRGAKERRARLHRPDTAHAGRTAVAAQDGCGAARSGGRQRLSDPHRPWPNLSMLCHCLGHRRCYCRRDCAPSRPPPKASACLATKAASPKSCACVERARQSLSCTVLSDSTSNRRAPDGISILTSSPCLSPTRALPTSER